MEPDIIDHLNSKKIHKYFINFEGAEEGFVRLAFAIVATQLTRHIPMSSKRPSSKDEVQDDDYGSDDDNEIDRINREKKEILQLSTLLIHI